MYAKNKNQCITDGQDFRIKSIAFNDWGGRLEARIKVKKWEERRKKKKMLIVSLFHAARTISSGLQTEKKVLLRLQYHLRKAAANFLE